MTINHLTLTQLIINKAPMFEEFKKVTKKDWEEKATEDLTGKDVYETYNWKLGSIELKPYYDVSDLANNENYSAFQNRQLLDEDPSGDARVWYNLSSISVSDVKSANENALNNLMNGADGIEFNFTNDQTIDYGKLLKDIKPEYCFLSFRELSIKSAVALCDFLFQSDNASKYSGCIHLTHYDHKSIKQVLDKIESITQFKCLVIDTKTDNDVIEEIAEILIKINTLLSSSSDLGIKSDSILKRVMIRTEISTDYFGEIAKVRALRNLSFQLAHAYGIKSYQPEGLHIQSVSSAWTNEAYQPHANMLKSSTAGMAAILGGCDSLIVKPENENESMQARIARNVSSILKEESFFSKTADPVAGSYYLETLTDTLAHKSWDLFKDKIANNEA